MQQKQEILKYNKETIILTKCTTKIQQVANRGLDSINRVTL